VIIDALIRVAQKAGPNLTTDSFIRAMDTMTIEPDMFGSPKATYSAQKRLGNDLSRLSQIKDGRWVVVADYMK
jgi:branched-chain amino acid transport system substrate-binding protein